MLIDISSLGSRDRNEVAQPSTPMGMLQGCHARIRHFMQLSRTLADATTASASDVADTAAAIQRYFRRALPLHEADENQTLFPRLQDLGAPLHEAARLMVEQHHAIDELMPELLTLCDSISLQPERLPSLAGRLRHVTAALELIFASHLYMEETVIFPALARFAPAQLEEMTREMQQRRIPPRDGIHLVR